MKTSVWAADDGRTNLQPSSGEKKLLLEELDVWDNEGGQIPDSSTGQTEGAEMIDGSWYPAEAG